MIIHTIFGLVVAAVSYVIYQVTRTRRNVHDPAWKPTGVRPMTVWSYDEQAAVKAARRARKRTPSGRRYHASKPRETAAVVPLRRVK